MRRWFSLPITLFATSFEVSSDIAIVAARKLMEKAIRDIQAGGEPPHVMRKPEHNNLSHLLVISDLVSGVSDWKAYTRALEQEARKNGSP